MPPKPPSREVPAASWKHHSLYEAVKLAIYALPQYFRTETVIGGIRGTDLFTLNAVLAATIEDQVVLTLNTMRSVWDPNEEYKLYSFIRQSQTFPDVRLVKYTEKGIEDIILGIELKGWYLLAKEGEPSFRYAVTPAACAPADMLVVVPWALSNVLSGSPKVFSPYIESARFAAEYRNYHWQHLRQAKSGTEITAPKDATVYPKKADQVSDKPVSDAGGNFGRYARTGLMDNYLATTQRQPICGIEAQYWVKFFKAFQEQNSDSDIGRSIDALVKEIQTTSAPKSSSDRVERVQAILEALKTLL